MKTPSYAFYTSGSGVEKTSIMIYVRQNGKIYKHATGIKVVIGAFDTATQRVNRLDKNWSEYNVLLKKFTIALDKSIRKDNLKIDKYFWMDIDDEVYNGGAVEHSEHKYVIDYIDKIFIPRNGLHMELKRIGRFKRLIQFLQEYETEYKIKLTFEDITLKFYQQLKLYMINKRGYSSNYFGTIIKLVKQITNEAYRIDSLHNNTQYLLSDFKILTHTSDAIYLTPEEIQKIYRLKIDRDFVLTYHPNSTYGVDSLLHTYQVAKDKFLIGCATGLRVSDYNQLKADNIQGKMLTVITQKTKQKVVIPLSSMVQDILTTYDWKAKLSDQKIRSYIKTICQAAGINDIVEIRKDEGGKIVVKQIEKYKLVSTHTARRSFATNAYKAGIPALQICKLTGHTTERALLNYIKISNEETAELLANNPFFK